MSCFLKNVHWILQPIMEDVKTCTLLCKSLQLYAPSCASVFTAPP